MTIRVLVASAEKRQLAHENWKMEKEWKVEFRQVMKMAMGTRCMLHDIVQSLDSGELTSEISIW